MTFWRSRKKRGFDIEPDEIFADSKNFPNFDVDQFEGRLERSISRRTIFFMSGLFLLLGGLLLLQVGNLQAKNGDEYLAQSENNHLKTSPVFPARGTILDRNGVPLVWNVSEDDDFETAEGHLLRRYFDGGGLSHVLGYVSYPKKDKAGVYYQESIVGKDGIELFYDFDLSGETGLKITETDALSNVLSESVVIRKKDGEVLNLTIDSKVQNAFHSFMGSLSRRVGFSGGGGVIMDIESGEVIALVSFPEYDSQTLTDGTDSDTIKGYIKNENNPFLNRVVSGLYAPGSIIKPFVAIGALSEGVITPGKKIFSSGSISIPNPYDSSLSTIFNDWKAHGWVDMKNALAFSSNVYFFEVGGGFESQKGIGIAGIEKYSRLFGVGESTGIDIPGETGGTIPNPSWKEANFPGDPWRVGDTYNTSIGQYGFQVTPIQVVRAVGAIANGGVLVSPHIVMGEENKEKVKTKISEDELSVVREGMRRAVLYGTGSGLNIPAVKVAAKTGTAELGFSKRQVNSWVTGFFPYESPKYAFATVMEKGPVTNTIGSLFVMRELFEWMSINTPEYFK